MTSQLYPIQVAFSGYAIIGLTLLIMAATVAVYLLRLPVRSLASRYLTLFFTAVAISGSMSILSNAFFLWDRLFVPWQDFWILAGGVALSQFAYTFPRDERARESRAVLLLTGGLALLALAYSVAFDFRFLFRGGAASRVSDAYYLLLPLGTAVIVILFLRRSVHHSVLAEAAAGGTGGGGVWRHLRHPQGKHAQALRGLAFALSLAFLPAFQTIFRVPAEVGFVLSNIGSLLAITAIALVYFNVSAEVNTFMAKLVGITLATVLLIFSVTASWNVRQMQDQYAGFINTELALLRDALVRTGELSSAPSRIAYVVSWETTRPDNAAAYRSVYVHPDNTLFDLDRLIAENAQGYLASAWQAPVDTFAQRANRPWQALLRFRTYPPGSSQADYLAYLFEQDGVTYEIGTSAIAQSLFVNRVVGWWMLVILLSSALVLLAFPSFFRLTLVRPLQLLLAGVKRVNDGDLNTAVEVQFSDEIGFLTRSFNNLTHTLKQAQQRQSELFAALQASHDELEERVTARTNELSAFTDLTMLPGDAETLAGTLQPALTRMTEVGLCDALCVHLLAEDARSLKLVASRHVPDTAEAELQQVALTVDFAARIRLVDDPVVLQGDWHPDLPAELRVATFQGYLGCPLVAGTQTQGWLSCYRDNDRPFAGAEISLLLALARQIGILAENHRLREHIRRTAVQDERRRLARDLHDSVSQLLYSITLFTRSSREALEDGDTGRLATNLAYLGDTSLQALREMRSLLFELQPPVLEEAGLEQALNMRLDMVERRVGLQVQLEVDNSLPRPQAVDAELYYMAIEALNNVLKHADADRVTLQIARADACLRLVVADNGRGFDATRSSSGMGLKNMRQRAVNLGGELTIATRLNAGTTVTATIPLAHATAEVAPLELGESV